MDWKRKLTSRKLWVAVADFVGMLMIAFGVAEETVTQVAALIMAGAGAVAYVIAEGLTDAASVEAENSKE
jgi:drug/metabolite transporter (DMT)-like permease